MLASLSTTLKKKKKNKSRHVWMVVVSTAESLAASKYYSFW